MTYSFQSIDKRNGKLVIDSKGMNDGYFFAAVAQPMNKKLKLRVIKGKDMSTFDLKNNGTFEMFPLSFGDGSYQIALYENAYSNKYAAAGVVTLNVKLKDKNASFLVPNQYVNYHQIPELVAFTKQLCAGKNKNDSYKAIKSYIKTNYIYDFIKAINIKKGILPDIKGAFQKHSGICFDLAALAVAMLRIADIPAKLVVGYADKQYHAWVDVIGTSKDILYDPTAEINGISKVKTYTVERYY